MAEPKKRPATTATEGSQKRPKFEKNFAGKSSAKTPFKKPGRMSASLVSKLLLNSSIISAGKGFNNANGNPFQKKFGQKPGAPGQSKFEKKPEGDNQQKAVEKTDWNKLKKDKKELKLKRRAQDNDMFELTTQAKKIYEKLKS